MITVSLFAGWGEVARTGEHLSRWQTEVGYQKLMVDVSALTAAPFALERLGRLLGEICEVDQSDCAVGLTQLELSASIGGAVAKDRSFHQALEGLNGRPFGDLA